MKFLKALLFLYIGTICLVGIGQTTPDLVQNATEVVQDYQSITVLAIADDFQLSNPVTASTIVSNTADYVLTPNLNVLENLTGKDITVVSLDPCSLNAIEIQAHLGNSEPITYLDVPIPNAVSKSDYIHLPEKNFKNPRDGLSYN